MNPIREDLKAFVDGELSEARMEEVRQAVAADPGLQKEVDDMRLLGFEIKKMATEPAVVGKEAVLDKVRRPKVPWWDASRLSGRLAYSACLFLILGGVGAVLFPVFSQAKESSKRAQMVSAAKEEAFRNEMAGADAAPSEDLNSRYRYGRAGEERQDRAVADGGGFIDQDGFGGAGKESDNAPAFKRSDLRGAVRTPPGAGAPGDQGTLEGEVFAESETPAFTPPISPGANPAQKGKVSTSARANRASKPTVSESKSATPSTAVPPSNRMVIKNADISLKVDDAATALTEAEALAKSLGGYVEGGNLTSMEGQTPHATCTLRVRSNLYETAMKALRGMGEVLSETSNADDVTAEHADSVGRLSVLRAEADSYVTMLRGARRIGEIMEIKDRLSQVRQQIASLESQRKALQNESSLSTIRATFNQKESVEKKKEDDKSGFGETWAKAQNGLSTVGEFLGNLAIYVFVFSPIWLPPVVLFWWLTKKAKG